jgi:DNA-binding NarL/FixJ family response regulator
LQRAPTPVINEPLTAREHQVLELVEQGFKNKEIALELGIRPGTVKIHLKHIFEKTGVRGRYGLAISGLKDKGIVSIASWRRRQKAGVRRQKKKTEGPGVVKRFV